MKKVLITIFLNVCIAALYIFSGKLGLSLAFFNPSASPIWAPTGIALAATLIFGYRVAPAIFIGAFLVNNTTAGTLYTSIGIATGNTLEAIVGAYLVKRFANGIHAFDTLSDILKFTFLAGVVATMVSAVIGTTTLFVGGLALWGNLPQVWVTWWLGDMGGSLVLAPVLLVFASNPGIHFSYRKTLHLLLSFLILFSVTEAVFSGIMPYPYLCIPIAVWIAFWFGQKGAGLATLYVAAVSVFYTLSGQGPFMGTDNLNQSLLVLQLFLNIFSLTTLIFAAAVIALKKSETRLQGQEKRSQALIENSFDAVVLIDTTSKIVYASPSVKRLLGYTPEELVGTVGFNLVFEEDRPMTMRELAKLVLRPGGSTAIEYRTIRKDGVIIWTDIIGTNLLLEPDVNAVVVNFRDITEEKVAQEALLEEKQEDEAMLTSIGDGILAADNKGIITMVNKVTCDTLGWTEKELLGKPLVEVVPMEDESGKVLPAEERPMTKVLSLGKRIVTSKSSYYVKKDKTRIPVRYAVSPIILNGKVAGTIEVFDDISREKEMERIKDDFISLASHELRTPMTAINGLLSMILKGDYGDINEGLKKPLENINLSAKRQIYLINDLLDISRLQSGKLDVKLTSVSLQKEIEDVVKSLQPLAKEKDIKLVTSNKTDVAVQADSEWVRRILNNLIGNALKFTNSGSITVSIDTRGEFVVVSVSDTGIGIEEKDRVKLFGKFQQLSVHIYNKPAGSGLGLHLSREIARKMGGDVELAQSTVGKGSTFALSLPKDDTKAARAATAKMVREAKIANAKHFD